MRRGVSITEILVVLALASVVVVALAPLSKDLTLEERRMAVEISRSAELGPVLDVLARDFARASSGRISRTPAGAPLLTLTPARRGDPAVSLELRKGEVRRRILAKDGSPSRRLRSFALPGELKPLQEGQIGPTVALRFQPFRGEGEVVILPLGVSALPVPP